MSKVNVKIHPLIAAAREHLREQAFSPRTVVKYNRLWRRLADYMAVSGFDTYNRDVGQGFLAHLYGQFSYSGLTSHEKSVVRKIQYLNEFQEKAPCQ